MKSIVHVPIALMLALAAASAASGQSSAPSMKPDQNAPWRSNMHSR
jgi:hypothetical protein